MKRIIDRPVLLTALALLSAAGSAAHAQTCGYIFRSNVSDLDQRRATASGKYGLPNDGNMYCVPTASMDNLAYMANHGYPNAVSTALPGPALFGSAANYNFLGACIATMGNYLGTTPTGGTGNYTNGLLNYLNTNLPGDYIQIFGDSFSPSSDLGWVVEDMAAAMDIGALVNMHIGWFERRGPSSNRYWERTGGHVVALNGADQGCTVEPVVYFRDPWTGGSLYSQSSYATAISRATFVFDKFSWKDDPDIFWKGGWQLNAYTGATKGFIGGYKAIWPNFGVGIDDSTDSTRFKFFMPKSMKTGGGPETRAVTLSTLVGPVKFMDTHPGNTFSMVVTNPPLTGVNDKLLKINHADGSVSQVLSYENTAGPIVFGNDGELYITDGASIKAINRDGVVRQTSGLTRTLDSLFFNDATRRIVGLDRATRRIDFYETFSLKIQSSLLLPADIELGSDACVTIDPSTGRTWLCPDAGGLFYEIIEGAAVVYSPNTMPGVTDPRYFQVTSKGELIVNDGGFIKEFKASGRIWVPANATGLAGQRFTREFRIPRTRETYDPATIDLYDKADQVPEQTIDCRVDLNDDGIVDFSDYLEFLNLFDAEDEAADFNEDGIIDFGDYLEFLNQFNEGC